MSLMKAPKLARKHLQALRNLVRLDFARAVRFKMESLTKNPEHPAESTLKVLTLTDMLAEADQPLSVTMALMDMHGAEEAWMPLTDERFNFYQRVLNTDVGADDFRKVPPDQLEAILGPLKVLQSEVRKAFTDADCVDPKEMFRPQGEGLSGAPPPKGMMN